MNWRKHLQLLTWKMRGMQTSTYLHQFARLKDFQPTPCTEYQQRALDQLLKHAVSNVPYYAQVAADRLLPDATPRERLEQFPVLTKAIIRQQSEQLLASNRNQRSTYENTSGGSTGEPVRLIQDQVYSQQNYASAVLFEQRIGYDLGQRRVILWGSERDLFAGSVGWKAWLGQCLTQTELMNAFKMTRANMRQFAQRLNDFQPRLIVAYAQAIYELAKFIEQEQIPMQPQHAIVTSAGTLYSFMRAKIEQVLQCPGRVFNRYGSREVGLIACEQPGQVGLVGAWMANYIEILDDRDQPVAAGSEGRIVVTNLQNHSMPLIRYDIGDRGTLLPTHEVQQGAQVLKQVAGRNVDAFRTSTGNLIDGEYFTHLLYFRTWVNKFQVLQRTAELVQFRIVLNESATPPSADLDDIRKKTKLVLGSATTVEFEFVTEIHPAASGKYRYTICEIPTT